MRMCVFLTHLCCICVKNFVVYQALLGAATFVLNASVSACLCVRLCVCVHMWMCVIAYYLHKYLLNTHQRQQQQLREESHNTFANGFIKVLILRAAKKFKDKYKYKFEILLIIQLSLSPVHRLNNFKLLFLLKHIFTHVYVQSDQMVNRTEN